MNKFFLQFLQITFVCFDIFILNLILLVSALFYNEKIPSGFLLHYYNYGILLNLSWLFLGISGGVYGKKTLSSFEFFTRNTYKVYLVWLVTVILYLFFAKQFLISRFFVAFTLILFGLGLMLNRFAYLGLKGIFKNNDHLIKRVVIVGYNELAKKLALNLEEEVINTKIMGFSEDEKNVHELSHYPILGGINKTIEICRQLEVNEIFSTISPEQNHSVYDLMWQAESECIRFRIVPDISFFINKPFYVDYLNDLPVLSLRREPLDEVSNRIKKRVLDILISFFITVFILSWLIPILGLLIVIESRGPVFFTQVRTGKNNKNFRCLKFRSMKQNEQADIKQATKNDNRVTKVGSFMRRESLDEFPQFINVLKGEMSLVGPRPLMVKHTEEYSKVDNHFMIRHFLKPGITGWAQVNGYRGEISEPKQLLKRINYDLWYLENWSFFLDIRILFLTVYNLFKGERQAY